MSRPRLVLALLYGGGLRLLEGLRTRVKDLDLERCQLTVRDGKGAKDRMTVLPGSLIEPLRRQIRWVRDEHHKAQHKGYAGVEMPFALARKYPNAQFDLSWQYLFPAQKPSRDPESGAIRRHHIHERTIQKALRRALLKSGVVKHASCHTLRHNAESRIMPSRLVAVGYTQASAAPPS